MLAAKGYKHISTVSGLVLIQTSHLKSSLQRHLGQVCRFLLFICHTFWQEPAGIAPQRGARDKERGRDGAEEPVIKHRETQASPETCTCWVCVRGQTPHNVTSGCTWHTQANYWIIKVFWEPRRVGGQPKRSAKTPRYTRDDTINPERKSSELLIQ